MATRQLVSTTGLASSTGAQDYLLTEAQDYSRVTVFAVDLGGAETLTAYIIAPNGSATVIATTEAGTAAVATPAVPSMVLVGGPAYLLSKTATAAAGSAYFSPCTGG